MVVRVSVVDAEAAKSLVKRLAEEIDAKSVKFAAGRGELRVELSRDPDRALVRMLSVLEHWLRSGDHPPLNVEIDEHSYVLGPAPTG